MSFDLSKWFSSSQTLSSSVNVPPFSWIYTRIFLFLPKYSASAIFFSWWELSRSFICVLIPSTCLFNIVSIIAFLSNDFLTASIISFLDFSISDWSIWSPFWQEVKKCWNVYKSALVDYFNSSYYSWVRSALLSSNYWSWSSNLIKQIITFSSVVLYSG